MHSEIVGIHYFSNVYKLFQIVKFHYFTFREYIFQIMGRLKIVLNKTVGKY